MITVSIKIIFFHTGFHYQNILICAHIIFSLLVKNLIFLNLPRRSCFQTYYLSKTSSLYFFNFFYIFLKGIHLLQDTTIPTAKSPTPNTKIYFKSPRYYLINSIPWIKACSSGIYCPSNTYEFNCFPNAN